jgi:L-asparaginase
MTRIDGARPVAVLYTGGTFGMVTTPRGLAPDPHLKKQIESLVGRMSTGEAAPTWTYETTARAIDSAELQPGSMAELADGIRKIVDAQHPVGVVVIHGTDTMAYSAAFAAFALADADVPVVFTGAQVPLGMPGSDAPDNFAQAFAAASEGTPAGTWIAFGGRLLPAVRATKRSSRSLDAFATSRPLAPGSSGAPPELTAALTRAAGRDAPRIGLVKVSPGLTGGQLAAALTECPAGVVLECYGSGTAPMTAGGLTEVVRAGVDGGSIVLAITQCADGGVDLGRYAVGSLLADAGAVAGGDMTPESALGKLAALRRTDLSPERVRALLAQNILGEREDAPTS